MDQELDVFIFYFDVIGVIKQYVADPGVLTRLSDFQRAVRNRPLGLGAEWSYVVSLYDNIWARINADEMIADYKVLELAGLAMAQARHHGFNKYFGVCTGGRHVFSLLDKTLIGGAEPVDITYQHIDSASEPQLRAGAAEKCSAGLAKAGMLPVKSPCVWVSEEVANYAKLEAFSCSGSNFSLLGTTFDVSTIAGSRWPFPKSARFTPIGPK